MTEEQPIAVVILAAGGSSRMGKPKQLLPIDGVPLLQKAVDAAKSFAADQAGQSAGTVKIYVVLGASSDEIKATLDFNGCTLLQNSDWQRGLAGSIILAIKEIDKTIPEASAVLLMMGDQPFVTGSVLGKISDTFDPAKAPIVVSSFCDRGTDQKIPGPPALFAREFFADLIKLEGDSGARSVVMAHQDRAFAVDFAMGAIDIDTESDYIAALSATKRIVVVQSCAPPNSLKG